MSSPAPDTDLFSDNGRDPPSPSVLFSFLFLLLSDSLHTNSRLRQQSPHFPSPPPLSPPPLSDVSDVEQDLENPIEEENDNPADNIEPFDINSLPPTMETDDGLEQEIILQQLHNLHDPTESSSYHELDQHIVRLSTLQAEFTSKRISAALARLKKKNRVRVDGHYKVDPHDPLLSWNADSHYLDFMTCVAADIGLDALIPNLDILHTFQFSLNLRKPLKHFRPKFAKLGFDPLASFLWIGRTPSAEDAWIAMAPRSSLRLDAPIVPPGTASGPTKLDTLHYRILIQFFVCMLQEIRYPGLYIVNKYPTLNSHQDLTRASNILSVFSLYFLSLCLLIPPSLAISLL
jgi:hypothetical protein